MVQNSLGGRLNKFRLLAVVALTTAISLTAFDMARADDGPIPDSAVVTVDSGNDWSFTFPIDEAGNPIPQIGPSTRVFGAGISAGHFTDIHLEGNYLVWGAQSSCVASNNQFYLHQVKVELHDSCLYGICIFFEKIKTIYSLASSNYSRVATASGRDYCLGRTSGNSRTYEQRVWVTIRSVTYGVHAQTVGIPNCDINP